MAKKKTAGIYKITNIQDGKVYIGQSIDIYSRWKCHKCELRKNKHRNTHLQRAWNLYGSASFLFEIIKECPEDQLDYYERKYINEYNALDMKHGYNYDSGGNVNKHHSEETKRKISESNKGRRYNSGFKRTEEQRRRQSEYMKKHPRQISDETREKMRRSARGNKNKLGKPVSEETRRKLSVANKGKILSSETRRKMSEARGKKVGQYDEDMNLIATYNSVTEASKQLNLDASFISKVCRGVRPRAGGYLWKYTEVA